MVILGEEEEEEEAASRPWSWFEVSLASIFMPTLQSGLELVPNHLRCPSGVCVCVTQS